jgi:hypothetical protein
LLFFSLCLLRGLGFQAVDFINSSPRFVLSHARKAASRLRSLQDEREMLGGITCVTHHVTTLGGASYGWTTVYARLMVVPAIINCPPGRVRAGRLVYVGRMHVNIEEGDRRVCLLDLAAPPSVRSCALPHFGCIWHAARGGRIAGKNTTTQRRSVSLVLGRSDLEPGGPVVRGGLWHRCFWNEFLWLIAASFGQAPHRPRSTAIRPSCQWGCPVSAP